MIRSICVYAGASAGTNPEYTRAAADLGRYLAHRGITMVYGGGHVGLMGACANAVLAHGGKVLGVIPQHLVDMEVAHSNLSELRVVSTMHERKFIMAEEADAFIALPGGIGTAEELLEILTWLQLGLHAKPVGVINVLDFYTPLLTFLRHTQEQGFLRPEHVTMLNFGNTPSELFQAFNDFVAPVTEKWLPGCPGADAAP